MLSELPYVCLEKEIEFLRLDLECLSKEIDMLVLCNNVSNDVIERQRILFNWKKTRLEAMELFAHAQLVISEIQPPPKQPPPARQPLLPTPPYYPRQPPHPRQPPRNRTHWRRWQPRQYSHVPGPSQAPKHSAPQNMVQKDHKEKKEPPSQVETIVKNIKTEDNKKNVFLEILKNIKKEKVDDENCALNNNIDQNFIPQLIAAGNIKTELDLSIVKSEISRGRKRKSKAQRRLAKRIKIEPEDRAE